MEIFVLPGLSNYISDTAFRRNPTFNPSPYIYPSIPKAMFQCIQLSHRTWNSLGPGRQKLWELPEIRSLQLWFRCDSWSVSFYWSSTQCSSRRSHIHLQWPRRPTYKQKEFWWIKTPFSHSYDVIKAIFLTFIWQLNHRNKIRAPAKKGCRILWMISQWITAAEKPRGLPIIIQNIWLNMNSFGSLSVCIFQENLSRFNRSICNKTMDMFASLLISVDCAASCVLTNKIDVDWVDFIRKVLEIMFQLCPR